MKNTFKRLTALTVAILLLCSSASADWTCGICHYTWQDGTDYCDECGFDAPINGLRVTNAGQDFIMLKWYGATTERLTLLWCVSGTEQWQTVDNVSGHDFILSNLQNGVNYDIKLMVDHNTAAGMITAATMGVTPAPESKDIELKDIPEPTPTSATMPQSTATPDTAHEPATEITVGEYTCHLKNGKVSIKKYNGKAQNVSIPETVDGYPVTEVGARAFSYCIEMMSVTIPDSVTSIGDSAFVGCSALTSITIPDTVVSVGNNPFTWCSKLHTVEVSPFHPTLETIDGVLFEKNEKRLIWYPATKADSSYAIPQGIVSIDGYAFGDCSSLTGVTIPDSVTTIGDQAFSRCDGLTSITIPDSVTQMGINPFVMCRNLHTVEVGSANPIFTTIDGVLINKKMMMLLWYPKVRTDKEYVIPEGIVSIYTYAFYDCGKLRNVTIPDSVTTIASAAFYGCAGLTSMTIPSGVSRIGDYAFYGCNGMTSITIPASVTDIADTAFAMCGNLTLVVDPDSYAHRYATRNKLKLTVR